PLEAVAPALPQEDDGPTAVRLEALEAVAVVKARPRPLGTGCQQSHQLGPLDDQVRFVQLEAGQRAVAAELEARNAVDDGRLRDEAEDTAQVGGHDQRPGRPTG